MLKKKYLVFVLVSFMFIGFAIYGIVNADDDYETTKGIIVKIEEYYDPIDDIVYYTPYIDYEVNNTSYKNVEYGAYNSNMKVGNEVNVYYKTEDPSLIQAEGYKTVPYIVLGIGVVFLIVSLVLFVKG